MRIALAAVGTLGLLIGIAGWIQVCNLLAAGFMPFGKPTGIEPFGFGLAIYAGARLWMAALPGRGTKATAQVAGD